MGDVRKGQHSRDTSYIWGRITDVTISFYADDTAVSLRDRFAISSIVKILNDFAAVSGLLTNRANFMIMEPEPRGLSMLWTHATSNYSL